MDRSQGRDALDILVFTNLIPTVVQWNQPSIDFYEKCIRAKKQDEWVGMRLEEEGIEILKNITTNN